MTEPEDEPIDWNIKLDFNLLDVRGEAPQPQKPKIPPRVILQEKYPKILERIEILWGSIELHNYLEHTLTTDRSNRQGFPLDVIQALGEIHLEHRAALREKSVLKEDLWEVHYKK